MRSLLLLLLLLPSCLFAQSQGERILAYDSRIEVLKDGTVDITENITVLAQGNQIERGIYRDFPTLYPKPDGGSLKVDFQLLGVKRDGRKEAYHLENRSNGIRIYAGEESVSLEPGEYTYTFHYQTKRQLGFFEEYDELYWNVTGNGWQFLIDTVSAHLILPEGARILEGISAYSGPQGAKDCDCLIQKETPNSVRFGTTASLGRREGLTIAVPFEKGTITPPGTGEKMAYFFQDYLFLLIGFFGLLAILLYYLWAWRKVGKDPDKGAIFPRFAPPEGMSPAAVGYMHELAHIAYPATLVHMASKGYLRIKKESVLTYSLEKTGGQEDKLSEEEKKVAEKLFSKGDKIELKKKNMSTLLGAKKELSTYLQENYLKRYFTLNQRYLIPGFAGTFLVFLLVFLANPLSWEKGPFLFGVFIFLSLAIFLVLHSFLSALRVKKGVFGNFFFLPFLLTGTAVPLYFFSGQVIAFILILLLFWGFVAVNTLFLNIMKAASLKGRVLLDEIEGFKMYLETAESELLKMVDKVPEKSVSLYERFLPYAMALHVESAWGDKFKDEIAEAIHNENYSPSWYHGDRFTSSSFNHAITTNFSNAIVASSTPSSSSSGSGGSGSSGGGGGGGGGGGW